MWSTESLDLQTNEQPHENTSGNSILRDPEGSRGGLRNQSDLVYAPLLESPQAVIGMVRRSVDLYLICVSEVPGATLIAV